jgi:hypothetical protein
MALFRDRRTAGRDRQQRRRRYVSTGTLRMLRLLGFRHSLSRDAYILRLVGNRFGPVLRPAYQRPREQRETPVAAPRREIDSWNQPTVTAGQAEAERTPGRGYTRR